MPFPCTCPFIGHNRNSDHESDCGSYVCGSMHANTPYCCLIAGEPDPSGGDSSSCEGDERLIFMDAGVAIGQFWLLVYSCVVHGLMKM